jgi:hypothetical protein
LEELYDRVKGTVGILMRSAKNRIHDLFLKSHGCQSGAVSYPWTFLIFSLEVIALSTLHLPINLTFYKFAFHDEGSNLTVQFLLAHGFRPVIDFGYFYGLLALPVEHLWFSCSGMTPYGYQEAMLTMGLFMAWAFARFTSNLQLSGWAVVLLASALPIAVMSSYSNFAQALEAMLLCNALAEHAGGHRRIALLLAGVSCLIKPALGYFCVILLIALAMIECRKSTDRHWYYLYRLILPAGTVCGILLLLVALIYGWTPLLWTLFPVRGAQTYSYLNNGLFRAGRTMYYFQGVHVGYYFGTIAAFYLYGTLCVFVGGMIAAHRFSRAGNSESLVTDELMIVTAVLHAIFVFGLFGNASSWSYYSYILVMGFVLALRYFGSVAPYVAAIAIALAILSNKSDVESIYKAWSLTSQSPTTGGLWAFPAEVQEWSRVNKTIDSGKTVVLSWAGCAFLLDDRLEARPALYALPFQSTEGEIQRYAAQVETARFVVAPVERHFEDWSMRFPEINRAVSAHTVLWQGEYFKVFQHR